MKNSIENDINREPKNNIKSVKFCSFVKNLKGFFLKKKRKKFINSENEDNANESEFFTTLKNMIVLNLKKEYVINYFKKSYSMRTKIETRSVAEYLCLNSQNTFFNKIKKIGGICKLYNLVQNLNLEIYTKGDFIFQYKDPTNKLLIIYEGIISLNLPYLQKKLMTIKEFLDYFFYLKNKFPKAFSEVEQRNQNIFDSLYKLKINNYNMDSISHIDKSIKKEFFIQETQKVSLIKEGNCLNEISLLYNLPQNFNVNAETDIWLFTLNRPDFMKILRALIENELIKEFTKLKKHSFIFNSWSNFFLGQIMNYYIPIKLIKKEFLYLQKNFSDSFYIINDGNFDVFCEISLSDFMKYKNYLHKNNFNILDWISQEKRKKSKITIDKIFDYIQNMKNNNSYPKDIYDLDKNEEYIKRKMVEKYEENKVDDQVINIKLNEDILTEKNTKIKIKLFTLHKNDFIGIEDSLELKSRFYSVQCNSDTSSLSQIRILDFIIFIVANNGIDVNNIYEYIKERKKSIIERVYKNLEKYLNNNKRIINNAYSVAFDSFDKKKMKYKDNIFSIKNMKNLNIDIDRNDNLIEKIKKSIDSKKKIFEINKSNNNNNDNSGLTRKFLLNKENKKDEKINILFDLYNNNYQKTEKSKSKKYRLRIPLKDNSLSSKGTHTQSNLSIYNAGNGSSLSKKVYYQNKGFNTINISKKNGRIHSANLIALKKNIFFKDENIKTSFNTCNTDYNINSVMYDKKFKLIRYKNLSFDYKLEKYLINSLGIYNTKREPKKINGYKDYNKNNNNKFTKKYLKRYKMTLSTYNSKSLNKKLIFSTKK